MFCFLRWVAESIAEPEAQDVTAGSLSFEECRLARLMRGARIFRATASPTGAERMKPVFS